MDLSSLVDRVRKNIGPRVLGAPSSIVRVLAGAPRVVDGPPLDPQIQLMLRLAAISRVPELCELGPARARAFYAKNAPLLDAPPPPLDRVEDLAAPGPGGSLPMRLYVPKGATRPGLLVWYHGGGFIVGDLDTHDATLRRLSDEARCLVLSVDYRLAPEHPFPAPFDDAIAAFRWAQEHAGEIGADPARVSVGGDSAGGNLAAVVSQATRGDRPPFLQVLVYAATDLGCTHASHRLFGRGYFLTSATISWFRHEYVGGDVSLFADPRISPLAATDLTGLAPAIVSTADFDPLRDEGRAYAKRLSDAGVRVDRLDEASLIHGYFNMTALAAPRRAHGRIARLVARTLA